MRELAEHRVRWMWAIVIFLVGATVIVGIRQYIESSRRAAAFGALRGAVVAPSVAGEEEPISEALETFVASAHVPAKEQTLAQLAGLIRELSGAVEGERSSVAPDKPDHRILPLFRAHVQLAAGIPADRRDPLSDAFDFRGADLRSVNFDELGTPVALDRYNFENADLSGAKLQLELESGASLRGAIFRGTLLDDAHARWCDFTDAVFEGCTVVGAQFFESIFDRAIVADSFFDECVLMRTRWRGATVTNSEFREGTDFHAAVFAGASLVNVTFRDAFLISTAFIDGTRLEGCKFIDSWLIDADFRGAHVGEGVKVDAGNARYVDARFAAEHARKIDFTYGRVGARFK